MTRIALLHNHYDADHLAKVVSDMRSLGAPTIKAVWMEVYGHWAALEGCHRLRAAHSLGITPTIEEVDYSDDMPGLGDDEEHTIEQIADSSHGSVVLDFAG